jgi:hypothetical protein
VNRSAASLSSAVDELLVQRYSGRKDTRRGHRWESPCSRLKTGLPSTSTEVRRHRQPTPGLRIQPPAHEPKLRRVVGHEHRGESGAEAAAAGWPRAKWLQRTGLVGLGHETTRGA